MKGNVIIAIVVGLLAGFLLGRFTKKEQPPPPPPVAAAPAKPATPPPAKPQEDPAAIYKVPIGSSPTKGPANARVTIVEVTDFECPYCARAAATMKEVAAAYPKDVRFVSKMNPLPFHKNAPLAAQAAFAAHEQGKFWEMHNKLFENQKALTRPDLERFAQELGLNMTRFKDALDKNKFADQIAADQKLAASLGATGTPAFFINGRKLVGAQPLEAFKAAIDEQLKKADELIAKGTKPGDVYEEIMRTAAVAPVMLPGAAAAPAAPPAVVKVDFAEWTPTKGPKDARVKIVEWSDFECPYCARGAETVSKIVDAFPKDVRFGFRNFPLDFHKRAMPAAKAAMAANKQGKFFEMHDKLFANAREMTDENIEKWAKEIGLNMTKFKADMASPEVAKQIEEDMAAARQAGVGGTPTFFINGKKFQGQFEQAKAMIDAELAAK